EPAFKEDLAVLAREEPCPRLVARLVRDQRVADPGETGGALSIGKCGPRRKRPVRRRDGRVHVLFRGGGDRPDTLVGTGGIEDIVTLAPRAGPRLAANEKIGIDRFHACPSASLAGKTRV